MTVVRMATAGQSPFATSAGKMSTRRWSRPATLGRFASIPLIMPISKIRPTTATSAFGSPITRLLHGITVPNNGRLGSRKLPTAVRSRATFPKTGTSITRLGHLGTRRPQDLDLCPRSTSLGGRCSTGRVYYFAPDWKEDHVHHHLSRRAASFKGYGKLYEPGENGKSRFREALCWAHWQRDFHDIWISYKSEITRGTRSYRPNCSAKTWNSWRRSSAIPLTYGSIISVVHGDDETTTALTDDGIDELNQMLSAAHRSPEAWNDFLDSFVDDEELIARVKAKSPR
ncbi:transposase IS66 family protein [Sinorhizobium americanum]|uniref:Transposase IS66 family protein n=1 Tax=Sinorhizobium americanum TaxID=194963 RepID=A0A4R2BN62_9HYPH|nr:transposase IS66 family protein [Sinorhizobium americanum]